MKKNIFSVALVIFQLGLSVKFYAQGFDFKKYLFDPPSTLSIHLEELNETTGYMRINGVDFGSLSGPFGWDWGDGSSEPGWFPMEHTYADLDINYIVKVTANYSGGESDEAETLIRFVAPSVTPIVLSDIIAVKIPSTNMTLGTRTFPGYIPPTLDFFDNSFFTFIPRSTLEYILSVAATVQMDFVNDNTYLFENKFEQYMLRDASFGGAYSLWFSDPVSFGVGDNNFTGTIGYSTFFHEMGHNFTLNTPANFHYGGRSDGNANAIYSETMAQIFQHATGYEIVNHYQQYGLPDDLMLEIKQSVIQSIKLVRAFYEEYIRAGKPFASWNDPSTDDVDETLLTFMTIAYKFFEHAENTNDGYLLPLKRMMTFLQGFCEDWFDGYDPQNNSVEGNSFRATLLAKALSEAFQTDLREEFRGLNFPISDEIYAVLPIELTSFTAFIKQQSVQLNWETETEVNNYGFEVERKTLNDWFKIGFVHGSGNSNSSKQYSFTDSRLLGGTKYQYRLKQIDMDGKFTYSKIVEVDLIAKEYFLYQNYPNPFNPTTTIGFGLPEKGKVRLSVLNLLGEEIRVLVSEEKEAGYHSVDFNASDLPSGVYFCQFGAGSFIETKKMLLLK